jgi:multiple sugar transport system permease protein
LLLGKNQWLFLRYIAILLVALFILIPIYAAIVGSLTPYEKLNSQQIFPVDFHWQNYLDVWERVPLLEHMKASFIYSISVSCIGVLLSTLAAYAISRFQFTGKGAYVYFLLITQVIPVIIIIIPLFQFINTIGIFDTYLAVILVVTAIVLPFPTFLLKGYFDKIPMEIEEAGMMDGCNRIGLLFRIVFPMATPGILTAFALTFFTAWQQFLIPLIITSSPEKVPVVVGIFRLQGEYVVQWELIMAATIIASIPPIIVYLLAQKYLVNGLFAGGIK